MSRLLALIFLVGCLLPIAAEELKPVMVVPDKLVYQSDFSNPQENLKKAGWLKRQATRWQVKDGRLLGIESTKENQQAKSHHRGYEARLSASMCPAEYYCQFSIRFYEGEATAIVPFVEFGHHIIRAKFDKVAGMSLVVDYETLKVAEAANFKWEPGKWYHAFAELKGNEFVIQFKDGPTLYAKHSILKEPAPSGGTGFGVAGPRHGKVEIDDVTIYSIKADAYQESWHERRTQFPQFKPVVVRAHPKKK